MPRTTEPQTISGLMRRALEGDRRSYTTLVETMQPRVRQFIRRRVPQADVVDDLVQRTFIRVHLSLKRYAAHRSTGDASVAGWFLTAAQRTVLDYRRSEYRRRDRLDRLTRFHHGAGFVPSRGSDDPEEALSSAQSRDAVRSMVRSAIDALPPDAGEIVRRHKLDGESMPRIAEDLGVAPVTARVRAHRAYRRLASLMPTQEVA